MQYPFVTDRIGLLRRSAHTASRETLRFRVLERRGNLALGEIPAGRSVILLPRLRDVDGPFFGLSLLLWRGLLRRGDSRDADQHEHGKNEREDSALMVSCERIVPRGVALVMLRSRLCRSVETFSIDRDLRQLSAPARCQRMRRR